MENVRVSEELGSRADRQADRHRQTDRKKGRRIDRRTDRQADRQTDTDGWTDGRMDGQTDKQTDGRMDAHKKGGMTPFQQNSSQAKKTTKEKHSSNVYYNTCSKLISQFCSAKAASMAMATL